MGVLAMRAKRRPFNGLLLPSWLLSRPGDGVWWQAGANTLQDVDARYDPAANPNYPNRGPWTYNAGGGVTNAADASGNIESWCGLALDLLNLRGLMYGVGHGDGAGTEIYSLEMLRALPTYVRLTDPYLAGGANGALDDGQEASNRHALNQPRSIHSYGALQARAGKLLMASSPAPYKSASSTYGNFWECDLSTGTWQQKLQETVAGNAGKWFGCAVTCMDTLRDRMYGWGVDSTNPSYWDFATDTPQRDMAVQPNINGTESWLMYLRELDIQVCLNRLYPGQIGVYDYGRTAGGLVHQPGATGNAPGESPTFSTIGYDTRMYHNGVWVPGLGGGIGEILCWHGGRNFHSARPPVSNPATNAWAWGLRTVSTGPNPGAVNINGVWGRHFLVPEWRLVGLVRKYDEQPWWFRIPDSWFEV